MVEWDMEIWSRNDWKRLSAECFFVVSKLWINLNHSRLFVLYSALNWFSVWKVISPVVPFHLLVAFASESESWFLYIVGFMDVLMFHTLLFAEYSAVCILMLPESSRLGSVCSVVYDSHPNTPGRLWRWMESSALPALLECPVWRWISWLFGMWTNKALPPVLLIPHCRQCSYEPALVVGSVVKRSISGSSAAGPCSLSSHVPCSKDPRGCFRVCNVPRSACRCSWLLAVMQCLIASPYSLTVLYCSPFEQSPGWSRHQAGGSICVCFEPFLRFQQGVGVQWPTACFYTCPNIPGSVQLG